MKHEMTEEFEKIDLFKLLRKFLPCLRKLWILILVLMVLNAGMTFLRLQRSYRPMYKCEAMFSVAIDYDGNSDISSYRYNYDKTAAEQISDSFPYILSSDLMNELIRQKLGTPYINGTISAAAIPGTNFFRMTVTSADPEAAYNVLLAAIETYPQVSQHIMGSILLNLVRDPVPPTTPYTTFTWHSQVASAAFRGMVLGLGIILVISLMRKTVLSTDELKRAINLPCLARVPNVKTKQRKKSTAPNLLINNHQLDSTFNESFRLLRLKLLRQLKEGDQVIMFTSSLPSEGKSSLTVNTALSLAKDGKKVLLIDADLRHPSVKSLLNITQPSTGLGNYLKDGLDAVSFIRYDNTKLFLFAGDESLEDPSKLLQHDKLGQLVQSVRSMFDYVILDTPPCGMMADASVFAQHTDKVVYVIREDYAAPHQIYDGIQSISGSGADICGYVFNRASSVQTSRYGYGYSRYGYGNRYGYGKKDASSQY